jgi:hypothetical protein
LSENNTLTIMKKLSGLILFLILSLNSFGQSNYVPLNNNYYHTTDRYEILNGKLAETYFSSVKPYTRKAVAEFIDTLANDSTSLKRISKVDRFNFAYLANDNWEWSTTAQNDRKGILKILYRKKSDAFHVNTKDFDLHVNPVLYLTGGYERDYGTQMLNSRGIEVRGMIDKKVGFYTFFTDNQSLTPSYVYDFVTRTRVMPNEGFTKADAARPSYVDFISARGYFNVNATKHIAIQFGYDRNFIGNGYRSLILSDFSNPYTFLKLNTKIWKLNYTNLFTEMAASGPIPGDVVIPKKYVNYHHLSINLFKNFNIGLFEAVALRGRGKDSTKAGQFDIAYLNPIIFYRAVEGNLGSPDNAILGGDFKWNFLRHFSLYGQIVLDEFVIDHVRAGDGWWANKQAVQGGLKYIDAFGIKNLDLQGEINHVRPYTYAHRSMFTNFLNYNQSLAHPLMANFNEFIGIVRYQPLNRLNISAKLFYTKLGLDTAGSNWGGNMALDYRTRSGQELGNKTGQGVATNLIYTSLNLSYMVFHNMFIDGYVVVRRLDSAIDTLDRNTLLGGVSLRWNIAQRLQEF